MTKKEEKALVKKNYEVATNEELPEWLKDTGDDFELEADEIITPQLLLAQKMSEILDDEDAEVKEGDWYNSLTKEKYEHPLQIVPIMKSNFRIKWKDDGTGLDCYAPDGKLGSVYGGCANCPHLFSKDNPCNKGISLLLYIINTDEVVVLPATKTRLTPIKRLLTTIKMKRLPLYAYIWNLTSEKKKNDKGTYYVPKFIQAGYITKELAAKIEELKGAFSQEDISKSVEQNIQSEAKEVEDIADNMPQF